MNLKEWLLIGFASIFSACTATSKNENHSKFDWYATESAPKFYPMEIIQGTFFYKGEANGLYIPSGGTISKKGWGNSVSHHVIGPDEKPLPDRVKIVFYSYAEKQFYKGEFDLPYEKILNLFREHYPADPELPYYSSIMIGIAPGGVVSIWLNGLETKEVFFGQAEKVDIDLSNGFNLPFKSKEQSDAYIEKQLVNVLTSEQLASLKKNGIPFGTWGRYRNLYRWTTSYVSNLFPTEKDTSIWFLNGEKKPKVPTQFSQGLAEALKPLPRKWNTILPTANGKKYVFEIEFDEFELMEAFEKLGANGELVNIEFEPRAPQQLTQIRVYNDKESIELKKTIIK